MSQEAGSLYVTKRTILHARENRFGRLIEKLETESLKVDDL
tara:strand:+ start:3908 stop:4030 length:123 start_codon:yes stop_codon:yes gene_type:complete